MDRGVEIEQITKGELVEMDDQKWVYDSSLDHKGRVPLRASTGVWKSSLFIITIEFAERLSYFGIATSLIIYLTKILHQDLKTAAKNVNYWAGVTTLMPLFGGFLADAYLGRFATVLASSTIYFLGLILLTMSRVVPSLRPCGNDACEEPRKVHEAIFYLAIYLISIGTGGHKPSLESFGADQFDDDHPEERKQKMSFFSWWSFGLCSGILVGVTVIVYIQDHVSWALADVVLTSVMAFSIVIFCFGMRFYRYRKAAGSPLKPLLQVLVAAFRKRNLPYPSSSAELYEVPKSEYAHGSRLICHTGKLKFLDKAAIREEGEENGWKLATVTKVEEMKLVINMVPIWLTTIPFGMCVSQATTFFIKQGMTLNREIINGFSVPPASIFVVTAIGTIISIVIYEKILVPLLRRATGNERGMSILQRIGIGMIFSVTTMVVAALVEKKRLSVVRESPLKTSISMSVFWLAPQFLIIGLGDGFTLVGLQEYFYDQVPDSMRSLGIAFYLSVLGAASFLSSLLITIVDHITERTTGKSWFGKDLNGSRLDYFYALLAAMAAVNIGVYTFVAQRYLYKSVQRKTTVAVADCFDADGLAPKV